MAAADYYLWPIPPVFEYTQARALPTTKGQLTPQMNAFVPSWGAELAGPENGGPNGSLSLHSHYVLFVLK